ncbi:hypothetical protein F4780DRAFT_193046 [Xylariomycetidae sp. FL0641]|nr:hypothetical protein F4780DRAFT_193046 [Xylariomycetidae sp. FL0641]
MHKLVAFWRLWLVVVTPWNGISPQLLFPLEPTSDVFSRVAGSRIGLEAARGLLVGEDCWYLFIEPVPTASVPGYGQPGGRLGNNFPQPVPSSSSTPLTRRMPITWRECENDRLHTSISCWSHRAAMRSFLSSSASLRRMQGREYPRMVYPTPLTLHLLM